MKSPISTLAIGIVTGQFVFIPLIDSVVEMVKIWREEGERIKQNKEVPLKRKIDYIA